MSVDSISPETRLSLLQRIRCSEDQEAWREFVDLYAPVIYRTVRYKGLQDADAHDVTQQVLVSVAKSLEQRPHDPNRARFRTWLSRVTRNAALNAIRDLQPHRASGDVAAQRQLLEVADDSLDAWLIDQEFERELFRRAAEQIRDEFEPATWQAFWMTAVEGQKVEEVAAQLRKQVGSIYAARSRVMKRLREFVQRQ